MVETAVSWIVSIWAVICVVGMVVMKVLITIKKIQCRKVDFPCRDEQCKWRHYCDKYDFTLEHLEFRIERLKEQIRQTKKEETEK